MEERPRSLPGAGQRTAEAQHSSPPHDHSPTTTPHAPQVSRHAKNRTHSDATQKVASPHPMTHGRWWSMRPPAVPFWHTCLKSTCKTQINAQLCCYPFPANKTRMEIKSCPPPPACGESGRRQQDTHWRRLRRTWLCHAEGSAGTAPALPRTGQPQDAQRTAFHILLPYDFLTLHSIPSIHRLNLLSFSVYVCLCLAEVLPCQRE